MAYFLNKTDGTFLVEVPDGRVDRSTSLTLVGKNFPTYGESVNQNFVKLLENFANPDSPATPLSGQLWFDSDNQKITFNRGTRAIPQWKAVAVIDATSTQPDSPKYGDLWFDNVTSQLKIFGTSWIVIGPQSTSDGILRITGSNSFDLQVGGETTLKIDPFGSVLTPLNPRVQAFGRTGGTNLTTANISTFVTWVPATVSIDTSNSYADLTGVFTATTGGDYRVFASIQAVGTGEHTLKWQQNNSDTGINSNVSISTGKAHLVASGIVRLLAGDQLRLVAATAATGALSFQNMSYTIELVG